MLKDTKSDTKKKGLSEMAQSEGFPGQMAQKKEQYYNHHKRKNEAGMKLDKNGD